MRTSSKSTASRHNAGGTRTLHWFGKDLDDDAVRRRFRKALRRCGEPYRTLYTPYWQSDFNDFLIFGGTLVPCGAMVDSIDPDATWLTVDCAGVQTEGICLVARFRIPTTAFTRRELEGMTYGFEFHPAPVRVEEVFTRERITGLEWRYDPMYDENGKENDE